MLSKIFNNFYHLIYLPNFTIYYFQYIGHYDDVLECKNILYDQWIQQNYWKFQILKIFLKDYYIICLSPNPILKKIANNISKNVLDLNLKTNQKQKSLSITQRQEIILNFADNKQLYNKNILLLDDICTTGNTIKAAINALKKYNLEKIYIFVLYKKLFLI